MFRYNIINSIDLITIHKIIKESYRKITSYFIINFIQTNQYIIWTEGTVPLQAFNDLNARAFDGRATTPAYLLFHFI